MLRTLKISLRVLGILVGLLMLLWIGLAIYVNTHKTQVLEAVTTQLNENITGKLTIESMEPTLLQGFPGISVALNNVLLRDSLFNEHKHDLLRAERIYVDVNSLSILRGSPRIRNISINNGKVYLYTDDQGYSNTRLFKGKKASNKKGSATRKINSIDFRNVILVFENRLKQKYFSFSINHLKSRLTYDDDDCTATVDLNTRVHSLAFNIKKGSFLQNKLITSALKLHYSKQTEALSFQNQQLIIGGDKILASGRFSLTQNSPRFNLNLKASGIAYNNAISLLTPTVSSKLKRYQISSPLFVEAFLEGKLKGRDTPLVKVNWQVNNARVTVAGESIERASFSGTFTNEFKKGAPRNDPNSAIAFNNVKGNWYGIPFTAKKVNVVNLKSPTIQGLFNSSFPLRRLNSISGSETFNITSGQASLNLLYKAPLFQKTNEEPYIRGTVNVRNAVLLYVPRRLNFKNINGAINFRGQDLLLQNIKATSGTSSLRLNGSVKNFVNLYYSDPRKILFDFNVNSPGINLSEFLAFLGKRQSTTRKTSTRGPARLFRQLDRVLNEASIHLAMKADRLSYKRFKATAVNSNITLRETGIAIDKVGLNHANGSLSISGVIDQSGINNHFNITSKLNNVDIRQLFFAFENFGQAAIGYENLKGNLYSTTRVKGVMKDNGQVVPRSIHGTVSFDFRNGALINFEPMKKIGDLAFPNRDFSNITFTALKNTLRVEGSKINIPPMTIQSSVLNLFVSGVYGLDEGTNISLKVPLRNPEKDKDLPDSLRNERMTRGIVLNLSAVEGDDGKIKIKLGTKEQDDIEEERREREEKKQKELKKEEKKKAEQASPTR